jgi:hypothetical protein
MRPLQLRELAQVAIISLISAFAGAVAFVTSELVWAAPGTAPSGAWYVLVFPITLVALPAGILAGTAIHLVVRQLSVSRIVLLPLFLALGIVVGRMVSGAWYGALTLSTLISAFAWILYCFGPLKLWVASCNETSQVD